MKYLLPFIAFCLLAFAGCRSADPIRVSSGVAIPSSLKELDPAALAVEMLKDPVIADRGWYIQEVMDDRLRLGLMVRNHEAVVDLFFTGGVLTPKLVSSVNLDQKEGRIHPAFNSWMENLERDLRRALAMKSGEVSSGG